MDRFIINVNNGVIIGAASFNSLQKIPSKPVPLFSGNDCINL